MNHACENRFDTVRQKVIDTWIIRRGANKILLPSHLEASSYQIYNQLQTYEQLEQYFDGAKQKFQLLWISTSHLIQEVKKNFGTFLVKALNDKKHISNKQVLSLRMLPFTVHNSEYNFVFQPVEYYAYLAFSSFLDVPLTSLSGWTLRHLYDQCGGTMDDGKTLLFPNSAWVSLNLVSYWKWNTEVIFQERNNSKTATTRIGLVSGASWAIDIPEQRIGSLTDLTSAQIIHELDEELGINGMLTAQKKNFHDNSNGWVQVIPGGFVISSDRLNPEFLFLGMTAMEFSDIENFAYKAKDSWEFKSLRSLDPSQVYRELLRFAQNQESKLNPHAIVSMIATMNTLAVIHELRQSSQTIWSHQPRHERRLEGVA